MTPARHRIRTAIIALSATIVVIGSCAIALASGQEADRSALAAETVQARILADTVTAALSFGDRTALEQYVRALRDNRRLEAVGVYGADGRLVASYQRGPLEPRLLRRGAKFEAAHGVVLVPVVLEGKPIGWVYLRQQGERWAVRVGRYVAPGSLALMALIMIVLTRIDARALARSNEALRRQIAEREEVEAALRQSQKMEAIGRLTGGIAHDFNNMLAVVIGSLDLLHRRLAEGEPRLRGLVENALEGARRAANLTQRLLAFSRLQPLKPEPVDVGLVLGATGELLRRTLGETIVVETIAAGGLWRARIDRGQLEASILNLAINARDAMPGGGKLTIEAGNAYLDRAYAEREPDLLPGQYVRLTVTDTGGGIPPDLLERVFEPFFTTKPAGLGTGLGLSQVLGFIKQSGGHVRLYSELGVGTSVKLYLPRSMDAIEEPARPLERARGKPRRDVTILVAEDEPGVRQFAVEALAEIGFDALAAAGGEEALALLAENPDVRLLLTDVVMPETNGKVLADRARAARPDLKVVFMTGYTQNAIVHNSMLDPGVNLLTKPFTVAELERELEAVLTQQ